MRQKGGGKMKHGTLNKRVKGVECIEKKVSLVTSGPKLTNISINYKDVDYKLFCVFEYNFFYVH